LHASQRREGGREGGREEGAYLCSRARVGEHLTDHLPRFFQGGLNAGNVDLAGLLLFFDGLVDGNLGGGGREGGREGGRGLRKRKDDDDVKEAPFEDGSKY